ncbi:MAG: fibronectin type III domain-containing protein [Patescibacteria group bacterium]|nr:fibronectin type III domain-containing protein [Patescibacteria group bacterium]
MSTKLIIPIVVAIIVITCLIHLDFVYAAVENIAPPTNKENRKTVNFVFLSYGSTTTSLPPVSLTASTISSTEIDLNWSASANTGGSHLYGYKIERDDGIGFNQIQNTVSTSYRDTGLTPNKLYSYRVYVINQDRSSDPSNVASSVTLSAPVKTGTAPDRSTSLSLDNQIKQRSADAQMIRQSLYGQNTTVPSPPQQYNNSSNSTNPYPIQNQTMTKIPNWVKAVFGYYAQGNLSDDDLINALEFLIKQGIIKIS